MDVARAARGRVAFQMGTSLLQRVD